MKEETTLFPSFPFAGEALAKYFFTSGVFTILLKDDGIIHFEPQDPGSFEVWLRNYNIQDMRSQEEDN